MERFLSTLSDNALYLYQLMSNISIGFHSYGPEQKGRR